jgi:hypothetical protein
VRDFMTLRWPWIAAFAVFVACIPLFAVQHYFYGDWPNHLGMIGYFGEYLKAHGGVPATFDTVHTVGRATPMFYGNVYLPALGAMSAFVGPWMALALAVAGLLFLQFASVRALLWDITGDETIACAAAIIVTWEIYPLTDLYNRAAIPEFFAITALQTGSCLWALYARDPARHDRASIGGGLLITIAAAIHPPTALIGCLTFGVLWLASLLECPDRRRVLKRSLAIGAGTAGVLAPWLYVVAKFGKHLGIVHDSDTLLFFPTSMDTVSTRLSLVPSVGVNVRAVGTPYLDTQVSVPIAAAMVILSVLAVVARGRDRQARRAFIVAGICLTATLALFALSISPSAWKVLPKAFAIVQFPYRVVAFVNVAVLAAFSAVLAALGRDPSRAARSRRVLVAALLLATVGVGFKLPRCQGPGGGADAVVTDYVHPPGDWYYGDKGYTAADQFAKLAGPKAAVKLSVGAPHDFAAVGSTHVRVAARTQISTNVEAFPWNVLTIDGRPVPREATVADGVKLATWIDAGEHDVGYAFHPDRIWSALRAVSLGLWVVWACYWAFGPALVRRLSRRRAEAPAYELPAS